MSEESALRKPVTFTLGGKEYTVVREEVDDLLKHVVPREPDKYAVRVHRRLYPPKQVVAVTIGLPLTKFTTMDASRIVTALGYELIEVKQLEKQIVKNESEQLFEIYLTTSNVPFEFEKQMPGTTRRPDFAVPLRDKEMLFEVKEFRPTNEDFRPGFGYFDPYGPIREKIGAARKKFKDLDAYCCNLVVFNFGKPLILLDWKHIYGAMLGNLGFAVPLDIPGRIAPPDAEIRNVFVGGTGAKMLVERQGVPVDVQNQTISSVIVLQNLAMGQRRFRKSLKQRERELGRSLTLEEFQRELDRARGTERDGSLSQLRVVVHENPYARLPLPRDLFRGPYDERYGAEDNRITRVFAGEEIKSLEEDED